MTSTRRKPQTLPDIKATSPLVRSGVAWIAMAASVSVAAAGLERDKKQHFFVSAALGAAGAAVARDHGAPPCEAARIGITFTVAIGAGKEFYDLNYKRTHWSWRDLFWDAAGATVGSLLASGCR